MAAQNPGGEKVSLTPRISRGQFFLRFCFASRVSEEGPLVVCWARENAPKTAGGLLGYITVQ